MIRGVLASLLLVEQKGKWYGHLRSRSESRTHFGKLAERLGKGLGGGGHFHAAGFETKLARDKILRKVLHALPSQR
jgi:nanoRNase/pAp phosphatase (c-di-AMP/oligoRNAs hydrolase)